MKHPQSSTQQRQDMLLVNQQQSSYYERPETYHSAGGWMARAWRELRNTQNEVRKILGVDNDIYNLHRAWMGDVAGQKVLDLGCYDGNPLSLELAQCAKSYLGIDLSEFAIGILQQQLQARGLVNAKARAVDFLSPEFTETAFDLVYAHSVAHHFRHFETFLQVLAERVPPGGKVITLDPLQTYWPAKIIRAIYRPFQPDKDWEWPFSKRTFEQIQKYFDIERIQGTSGRLKWAVGVALLNKEAAVRLGRGWHATDLQRASQLNRDLWRCLHVTMCWRKR
jgi:2-polyprenyl-3-methyl-5-hydroxy-6-metoxy-1,4-benzoquinol methylase